MSEEYVPGYLNRTLCDVLEAMRKCHETHNYSYLASLIEEAQNMANRMEAALGDQKDFAQLQEMKSRLRKEVKALVAEKKKLKPKKKK